MVMVRELMVDGDEGGEDGGEDGLRIPPPREKSWINLTPKTKIVVAVALCFVEAPPFRLMRSKWVHRLWAHQEGEQCEGSRQADGTPHLPHGQGLPRRTRLRTG